MGVRPAGYDARVGGRFQAREYGSRTMLVLAALGFSSGLPSASALGFIAPAWLKALSFGDETATWFTLTTLPFAFNFVWAPLLDRYVPPFLGRRRGWLVVLQGACALSILGAALLGPTHAGDALTPFAVALVVIAFFAASQDVVADAYRTDVLTARERGPGAAMFVNGYRVAMGVGAGGAVWLADHLAWPVVFAALAALMGIGIVASLVAREPRAEHGPPATLEEAVVQPFRDFVVRHGTRTGVILVFIALFKVPDGMARALSAPLLVGALAFDGAAIAWAQWTGVATAVLGAFVGGPLVARWGLRRSLLLFGVLQAASNLGFAALALVGRDVAVLVAVQGFEGLCGGLVVAGFVAFLMSLCNRRYSATQYALFTSIMFGVSTLTGGPTGGLAAAIGYPLAFAITALAGIPGLLLIPLLPRAAKANVADATRVPE